MILTGSYVTLTLVDCRRLNTRIRGLNLLEITLAMLLFSTIVVFICGIWSMHSKITAKSRARMAATFLAEQILEDCINDGFHEVDNRDTSGDLVLTTWMRGQLIIINYHYTLDVKEHPDYSDKLKIVTVHVEFPGEDASDSSYREVMYETMLCKMQ